MTEYREGAEVAGRFVIIEKIGEGGMGSVYRALQTSLDREVALKVLHANVATTTRARRRFAREARAIARLNHPHIASVYDFGLDDEQTLWLAMEMIHGEAMTRMKRDSLELMRVLAITDQILSALSAAHARGIIHRDLKPSNVLLTRDDDGRETIKLVDFGLAGSQSGELEDLSNAPMHLGDEDSEADRVILGTPRYMAPEIFRRAPLDPRVDLYALGVVLFEILSGQPPYPGENPKEVMRGHIKHPIPQLLARDRLHLPTDFERCIYKLLAKDANERFQTAAEVRELIAQIVSEFSYVPWMAMGPQQNAANFHLVGNLSQPGFVSGFGGQTVAPASMMLGRSKHGAHSGNMLAPLVGRVTERRVIEEHLRNAMLQGLGSLVFVEGEAGIGKTRLIEWLKIRVEEAGLLRVLQGDHTRASSGFGGMRSILERLLGLDDFSPEDAPFVIEQRLKKWDFPSDEIDLIVRLLASNRLENPNDPLPSSEQERLFSTLERLLRRAAQERPLLLLLEDLHHAGELTIGLLEHLAVGFHLSPAPIAMIVALRSEELEQLPRHKEAIERLSRFGSQDITRLHLRRLSHEEAAQLVTKILPVSQELAEELGERAAGNPLHIIQVIRFLQESGKLHYESGAWTLAEGVRLTREMPDEIADMMRYRADQTIRASAQPEATRALLERAAILGRTFSYPLLRQMLANEPHSPWLPSLDTVLDELLAQGILREAGHSGQDIIEFEHGMMRDVLLHDVNAQRSQRELHRYAADAKITAWGNHIGDRALEIAQHYQLAKHTRGVYKYTLMAARQALIACDLKSAMHLFKQVEELGQSLDEQPLDPFSNSLEEATSVVKGDQVALEVAHLERRLGEYDSARQDYRKLLNSSTGEITLWARWGLGDLATRQGEYDDATSWFEAARRDALRALQFPTPEVRDEVAQLVDAYCLYGLSFIGATRNDLEPAQLAVQEALERAMACQEKLLETEILRTLSDVAWRRGDEVTSEQARQHAMLLVERFGDSEEHALALLHHARHSRAIGLHAEALARAEQAQSIFEELGKRHYVAHCMLTLGHIALGRGDNKEAAQLLRKAHRFYEMFNDRHGLTTCKHLLADLAVAIRRFPDTQVLTRDALEGYRAMGDRANEARCWLIVGRLERELGRLEKAERTFADCAKTLSKVGDLRAAIMANLLRALTLEEAGRPGEADAILSDLLAPMAQHPFYEEGMASALDTLSLALANRRPDLAIELDTLAEALWHGLGKPSGADRSTS